MTTWEDLDYLHQELLSGNKVALGKAITLVESTKSSHREKAFQLLKKCRNHPLENRTLRIGITGVPGVGKSTFIEAFGKFLITQGKKKVAVLAVDPSSEQSGGSILGDKTRMAELSSMEQAFIRPTPSSGALGGVASKTREAILLCEAAGYEIVLIETVGVGQSETTVKQLCDFFLLLMLAGAGDELQGIKRGIMEMADAILINKSDLNELQARQAAKEYSNALHLFPPRKSGWHPKVLLSSGLSGKGIDKLWELVAQFREDQSNNGYWKTRRILQEKWWLKEYSKQYLLEKFVNTESWNKALMEGELQVSEGDLSAMEAAMNLVNQSLDQRV